MPAQSLPIPLVEIARSVLMKWPTYNLGRPHSNQGHPPWPSRPRTETPREKASPTQCLQLPALFPIQWPWVPSFSHSLIPQTLKASVRSDLVLVSASPDHLHPPRCSPSAHQPAFLPPIPQAHSYPWAFALAVSSFQNALSLALCMTGSFSTFNVEFK